MKHLIHLMALPLLFMIGYMGAEYLFAPNFDDSVRAPASQEDLASSGEVSTYAIKDGYGEYRGIGKTKLKAKEMAWEKCAQAKVAAYENRSGQMPDADTADMIIESCINQ